jgi:hypothetical protein
MRKQSTLFWFFVVSAFVTVTLTVWDLVHGGSLLWGLWRRRYNWVLDRGVFGVCPR